MKIENHILEILQLYEYAMSIGKTLSYRENCDSFLKLILKRKNLNACWIISKKENNLSFDYSLPEGQFKDIENSRNVLEWLEGLKLNSIKNVNEVPKEVFPIIIHSGYLSIFKLDELGYLFFFSVKPNISEKDLNQLQPVINKFSNKLKACKAYEKQTKLLKNLREQNQELNDYAQMVSHDLKSPIRNIETLSLWIKEDYYEVLEDSGIDQLEMIRNSAEKMDNIISGMLEYTTIGKRDINFSKVNLNLIVKDIIDSLEDTDGINFKLEDLPTVEGDNHRLKQIFQNLIINAIKYNDKPVIDIKISFSESEIFYKFEISDNGIGIQNIDIHNSESLGLQLVDTLTQQLEGRLELDVSLGTKFNIIFELPEEGH